MNKQPMCPPEIAQLGVSGGSLLDPVSAVTLKVGPCEKETTRPLASMMNARHDVMFGIASNNTGPISDGKIVPAVSASGVPSVLSKVIVLK